MPRILAVIMGIAILSVANYSIYSYERLLRDGRVVFLELAPVDPRSLMQGDYMALRFKVANDAFGRSRRAGDKPRDGYIILEIDPKGIGEFVRFDSGSGLAEDEIRIHYRIRNGRVKFATNAFFFQEGEADRYTDARYGEFRVSEDGQPLLAGLRDKNLERL